MNDTQKPGTPVKKGQHQTISGSINFEKSERGWRGELGEFKKEADKSIKAEIPGSRECISNLQEIGLSAVMWSEGHEGRLPSDFLSMKDDLKLKMLVCPGDSTERKIIPTDWAKVTASSITYQIVAPGALRRDAVKGETKVLEVYVRCPIHGHATLTGGWTYHSNS